jgi:GT2 family glycosyltransferase
LFKIEKVIDKDNYYLISGFTHSKFYSFINERLGCDIQILSYMRADINEDFYSGFTFRILKDDLNHIKFISSDYGIDYIKNQITFIKYHHRIFNLIKYAFRLILKFLKHKPSLTNLKNFYKDLQKLKTINYRFNPDFNYIINSQNPPSFQNTYLGITVYEGLDVFEKCLSSISIYLNKNIKIFFIIDNPIKTFEIEKIINKYFNDKNKIEIIKNESNIGYVKSANKLFKIAKYNKKNLILLNSDTEIYQNSIENIILALEKTKSIINPLVSSNSISSFPPNNELINDKLPTHLIDYIHQQEKFLLQSLPASCGCCLGIHLDVINKISYFDEVFSPGYGEEVDYSLRSMKSGITSYLSFGSYIYHYVSQSFNDNEKKSYLLKSSDKIIKKRYKTFSTDIQAYSNSKITSINMFNLIISYLLSNKKNLIFIYHENVVGGSYLYLKREFLNEFIIVFNFDISDSCNCDFTSIKIKFNNFTFEGKLKTLHFFDLIFSKKQNVKLYLNTIHKIINENFFYSFLDKVKSNNIEIIYLWHNYSLCCPNYELYNFNLGQFCNLPAQNTNYCLNCWSKNNFSKKYNIESLKSYREKSLSIQKYVKNRFFSNASLDLVKKIIPITNYEVISHNHISYLHNYDEKTEVEPLISNNCRIYKNIINSFNKKILIIGGINEQKGSKVLLDICKKALSSKSCIIFLGKVDNYIINFQSNFFNLGEFLSYNDIKFVKNFFKIELGLIPSVWKETYCYTADELGALGLKFYYFDVNSAVTERLNSLMFKNVKAIQLNPEKIFTSNFPNDF